MNVIGALSGAGRNAAASVAWHAVTSTSAGNALCGTCASGLSMARIWSITRSQRSAPGAVSLAG